MRYEPDVEHIILLMVEKSLISDDDKQILMDGMKNMKYVMDYYRHHNLRTFQFFHFRYIRMAVCRT